MATKAKSAPAALPEMFARAATVNAKSNQPKDKKAVHEIKELEAYATVCELMEALKTAKDNIHSRICRRMKDIFLTENRLTRRRPENIKIVEGIASASGEMRKRGENSGLTEAQVEMLTQLGLPTGTVGVPATFILNPAYAGNMELLAKLASVKGIPADCFLKQESTTKVVVTEETLTAAAAEPAKFAAAIDIICTLAIKAKLERFDLEKAIDQAKAIVMGDQEETKKDGSATLKATLQASLK